MKYRLEPTGFDNWFRIVALRDILGVCKAGDTGGLVKSAYNLSQKGNCWVDQNSYLHHTSRVEGDAQVISSEICSNAVVKDMAVVRTSFVTDTVVIGGFAEVVNRVIDGDARIMNQADLDEIPA